MYSKTNNHKLLHHIRLSTLILSVLAMSQVAYPRQSDVATLLGSLDFNGTSDKSLIINRLRPHLSDIQNEPSDLQFQFYTLLAIAYHQNDELANAHKYHGIAHRLAPASAVRTPLYARHLVDWAGTLFERQELPAGRKLLAQLYAINRQSPNPLTLLQTLNMDTAYSVAEDDWTAAQAASEQAMRLAFDEDAALGTERERLRQQALTLQRTARLYREFHPDKAIELYELALPLQRELHSLTLEETCLHYLAIFHMDVGNYNASRDYIEQLLDFAKRNERHLGFLSAYTSRSRLNTRLGEFETAQRDILRAEVHLSADPLPSLHQRFLLQKADILMQQENPQAVLALLAPQDSLFARSNMMQLRLQYYEVLGKAYAATGQAAKANSAQQQALQLSQLWQQRARKARRISSFSTPGNAS